MAALIPLTTPWATPLRGNSDGESDTHTKSTAPQLPGSDSVGRHHGAGRASASGRTTALSGAGSTASWSWSGARGTGIAVDPA